jgi:hypothetical protein
MLKKMLAFMLYCNACSAVDLNTIEATTAFLTIPAAMAQNNMATNPQKNAHHLLNISVDLLRLTNEILSIINNNSAFEYHKYDACWAIYDTAHLVKHIYTLFNKPEADAVVDSHSNLLLVAEGLCKFIAAMNKGQSIDNAHSRLICKSLNSALRLIDNIISSKEMSKEQIAYIIALIIGEIISSKDLYEISTKKEALRQAEEERLRQLREQENAQKEAEEAPTRRAREEAAARAIKILEEEYAQARVISEQMRHQREQEAARRQAEVDHAKSIASQRPEKDSLRIAWETVNKCINNVTVLTVKSNMVHNDLQKSESDARIASFTTSSSNNSVLDNLMKSELSSWAYKQRKKSREQAQAAAAFQAGINTEAARNKVRSLTAKAQKLAVRLEAARTAAVDAEATAMRLSREQGII